jgi:hypothetical protein
LNDAIRPHVNLLIAAPRPSALPAVLEHFGAWTTFVPFDQLRSVLARGTSSPLVVDAIVIEAADGADSAEAASRVAAVVRALPNDCAMQNGMRWAGIPLIAAVTDPNVATAMRYDPGLRSVVICDFQYGIAALYQSICSAIRVDREAVHAELDDAGCIIEHGPDGRFRMRGPARGYRHGGFRQVFETERYHGPSDRDALPASPWVIGADERAVAFDIDEFERLIWGAAKREEDLQRFLAGKSYFLNAARFELIAKPQFTRWDGDKIIPDIVIHPYAFDGRSVTPRIVELKWFGGRMVVGDKRRWRFRAEILGGIDQTRDYAESFMDPRNATETRRIFSTAVLEPKRTVIGGTIAANERGRMERAQRYIADVDVKAYNDVLEATRQRFAK